MDQSEIDQFINSLIEKKNLKGLTPEDRLGVANELKNLLVQQINRAILEKLPDQKLDEINDMMDNDNYTAEDIQKVIDNLGIDTSKIVAETMLYFEAFYLGNK